MRGCLPILFLASLVTLAAPSLAAFGMPEGVGENMDVINDLYTQIMLIAVFVFIFVMVWMALAIVRFRPGGAGRRTNEDHRGSIKAEIAWILVPLIIVTYVGVISYDGLQALTAEPDVQGEDPLEVQISGFQWFWQASYPGGVNIQAKTGDAGSLETTEPFLLPEDTPVLLNITAGDVIHALWVPDLGVKMDAVPGTSNFVWVEAPEGEYFSQCAEYCGTAHAYMRALFKFVPQDEYQAWYDQELAEAQAPDIAQQFDINLNDDGFEQTNLRAVAGAQLQFRIANAGDEAHTFEIEGIENGSAGEIEAGNAVWLNTTVLNPANLTMVSDVGEGQLTVVRARTVEVDLFEWGIAPDRIDLSVGTPTIFQVINSGQTIHNFYVGQPAEEAGEDSILWQSPDLQPGEETQVLAIPNEGQAGEYTGWCDIPGHYQQGMVNTVVVG